MLEMRFLEKGINALAENCPSDGNVSVTFSVKEGNVKSVKFSKTFDLFSEQSEAEEKGVKFFNDEFKLRILTDIVNQRLQYGTIAVSIEVEHGELKSYSMIPSFTLSANLLAAEMRHHRNKQLGKKNQVA